MTEYHPERDFGAELVAAHEAGDTDTRDLLLMERFPIFTLEAIAFFGGWAEDN